MAAAPLHMTPQSLVAPRTFPAGPNKALKLTRRAGCLFGEPSFGDGRAMRGRPCPSPAVQLSAGVRRLCWKELQ